MAHMSELSSGAPEETSFDSNVFPQAELAKEFAKAIFHQNADYLAVALKVTEGDTRCQKPRQLFSLIFPLL